MKTLRQVGAILWKDIAAELRTKEMFSSMFVFVLLTIIIFHFAFELRLENARQAAPGILWVTFSFAGILGLGRSFILEKDLGCLEGLLLAPLARSVIFFGKVASNVLFMWVVEAIALPILAALFNLPLMCLEMAAVVVLGTVGLAGVGTLFSAMVVNTRAREVLLPVMLFPIVAPALIAAVKLTAGILDGERLINHWLQLLVGFDILFLTIAYVTFDYVVEQ